MPQLRKKADAPPDAKPPQHFAEVRVGRRVMAVTVEIQDAAPGDVQVTVTRASVRIRSRTDPAGLNVIMPLPMTAVPGQHWTRFNHGVCDVLVARESPSD